MSVARAREVNARLRAVGITVHEYPGWESRGNGQTSAYEGGLVHHTATGYGSALPGTGVGTLLVNGRSDLSGPLCNYACNADGSVTVIAAHPANHAGASGGRSMGPLPVTTLFNKRVMGIEIVYPGDEPMRDAQYRTALIWSRIVTTVLGGGNIKRARAHAETSITGKWDPGDAPNRTINMTAFRRAAAIVGANPVEDDVTTPAELWGYKGKDEDEDAYKFLRDTRAIAGNARSEATNAKVAANGASAKVDSLAAKVGTLSEQIEFAVAQAVANHLNANPPQVSVDYDEIARRVVAELKKEGN